MEEKLLLHQSLKARQRQIRDGFSEALSLRVHRAVSWLGRSEQEPEDGDARFVFLWIAFNAAYANEFRDHQQITERKVFLNFLRRLLASDRDKLLYSLVWDEFPKSIRLLIDNRYVFRPFWEYHNGELSAEEWKTQFKNSKASAHRALGKMNTLKVLDVTFDRLYVLRNQLIHGGATWNSGVNRAQISQGVDLMGKIVPTIIHLMMDNPHEVWGDPSYPVVD